jgi:flagellar biosynthetic protein FlhB
VRGREGRRHTAFSDPPLARALYASVDIDENIKPEHYKAVAEVIGLVMRLKNKAAARKPMG